MILAYISGEKEKETEAGRQTHSEVTGSTPHL